MKQKDAVIKFWQEGQHKGLQNAALFEYTVNQVTRGLISGDISHKNPAIRTDEKTASKYARSVTSNYMKKAPEMGGFKYAPGATQRSPRQVDNKLDELSTVLSSLVANKQPIDLINRVEVAIASRKAEIAAQRQATKSSELIHTLAALKKLGIPQLD